MDAGVQTEPTPVIPAKHVLGLVGLQEPVAAKVSQDPGADGVLEALQELVGEAGGFVEAGAGVGNGRLGSALLFKPLEEAIDHAKMKVKCRLAKSRNDAGN